LYVYNTFNVIELQYGDDICIGQFNWVGYIVDSRRGGKCEFDRWLRLI